VVPPADSVESQIERIFSESIAAKVRFVQENRGTLARVVGIVTSAIRSGKKVLLFGNGGSAADAQHMAAEFTNRMLLERPPMPAIALTTDTSTLTSIANDYGYNDVFAKQVAALGQQGDVAIAISTSGNSPNVLAALRVCRDKGIHTIGLTGRDGGQVAQHVDYSLNVDATTKTPRIQETHIVAGHVICELVEEQLFGQGREQMKERRQPGATRQRSASTRRRPPQRSRRRRG